MDDVSGEIAAEKDNVATTLEHLKLAMRRSDRSVVELAAIATFLHNIYNGIENILKQTLKSKGMTVPKSETWHKDLLDVAVSHGVIWAQLSDNLRVYLAFRHFFVHGYGFMLEETHLRDLAGNILDIWRRFLSETELE